jgi:hypothetical protein
MSSDPPTKSFLDHITTSVAVLGSLITISLTVWNSHTKEKIDQRETELKAQTASLDAEVRRRTTSVDESKERVERYKWVYSIVPELSAPDASKRNAALAMVRLALTKEEAEGLLAGLQQSPNAQVRQAAEQGAVAIAAIENAELNKLVLQMNAPNADDRRRSTGRLERDFADSSAAISLVLTQLSAAQMDKLSPSGLINSLYYLSRTEPGAWTADEVTVATETIPRIRAKNAGPQTQAELARVEAVVKTATRK